MTSLPPAINAAMSDAFTNTGGDPNLLGPLVISRVRFDDASGMPIVLDASGNPETVWRDGRPVPATIDDLVKGLKANPTYAPAFGNGGSTSKPSVTRMSANDWLTKTSLATPEQRRVLFQEAAAGKFKIGN